MRLKQQIPPESFSRWHLRVVALFAVIIVAGLIVSRLGFELGNLILLVGLVGLGLTLSQFADWLNTEVSVGSDGATSKWAYVLLALSIPVLALMFGLFR